MAQTNIQIDPQTTRCVLNCLGYAIDEIKLVRSIHRLGEQARLSADPQFDPRRKRYLITEMNILRNRLEALREKARLQNSSL